MIPMIEYWQSPEDGCYYFHLKAPNGGILVQSSGYPTVDRCLDGIEMVRYYADIAILSNLEEQKAY